MVGLEAGTTATVAAAAVHGAVAEDLGAAVVEGEATLPHDTEAALPFLGEGKHILPSVVAKTRLLMSRLALPLSVSPKALQLCIFYIARSWCTKKQCAI